MKRKVGMPSDDSRKRAAPRPSRSVSPRRTTRSEEVMQTLHEPSTNGTEMTALLTALTALLKGQPGVRLPVEWTGVAGKVADAFNEVVEQNERMANELARLSRVVGKEGRLSQRANLGDVSGFWAESVV